MIHITPESVAQARVLVVEDEPLVAMLLLDLIEEADMTPLGPSASAQEALKIAADERPTIALVDVNLRGAREGLQAGARLAQQGVAIIFVSGHADVADWPEVRALAPIAVLAKPCRPCQVIEALRRAHDSIGR